MNKLRVSFVLLISLGVICVFTISSPAQEPTEKTEIEKMIEDACVDTQKGALFNYTYLLKASYEKKKKFGFNRKFTKVYEAIIPSRFTLSKLYSHPLILIQDSEKSVSAIDIDNARKELVTELERAEKDADPAGQIKKDLDGGYWAMGFTVDRKPVRVNIYKILQIAKFNNLQRRQVNGKDIISIDFYPQPVIIYDNSMSYMSKIEGQVWIDPETKRIIRVEGFPRGTFNGIKDKPDAEREDQAVLLFIQTKVAEGFWFPQTVRLNFMNNPEIFETVKLEFSYSSYKKSTVDVKDIIKPPEQAKDKTQPITEEDSESNQ